MHKCKCGSGSRTGKMDKSYAVNWYCSGCGIFLEKQEPDELVSVLVKRMDSINWDKIFAKLIHENQVLEYANSIRPRTLIEMSKIRKLANKEFERLYKN